MLAYLLRWWLGVGLRFGLRERLGTSELPSRTATRERYRLRCWLREQALAWAREEADGVQALAGDPVQLRWRLAYLSQTMAAVGWALARDLPEASR
jgi:hypothetical protein